MELLIGPHWENGYGTLERKGIIFGEEFLAWNMGSLGSVDNRVIRSTHGCSLCWSIGTDWESFVGYIHHEVGDGHSLRFWHDIWCESWALKELYPDFCSIKKDKDGFVHSYLEIPNARGPWSWNIIFGCDFNYWVLDQIDYVWHLVFQHPEWALTAWDGVWMVTVSLMFGLIMRLCTGLVVGYFLRRVFGKLRLQNELHSLCGQQHGGKSFQVTFFF